MSRPPPFDPLLDPARPSFSDRLFDARYARPQPPGGGLWAAASPPPGAKPRRRDGAPSRLASTRAVAGRKLRAAGLVSMGVGGGAAALAGWGLLAALVLTRTLAPPAATLTRDLWVDYTASPAVAAASFLPDGGAPPVVAAKGGAAPAVRAFGAGRRVDVWLTLETPDAPDGAAAAAAAAADVVQVRAELLAADGRVLASTSRPALLPYRSRAVRALRAAVRAPLVVAGLAGEMQAMALPLFTGFRDAPDAPAVGLRVALAGRPARGAAGADPPPLHSLRAHARQRLGWVVGALYLVRPRDAVAFPLYALSFTAIILGTAAFILAVVIALSSASAHQPDADAPGGLARTLRRLGWRRAPADGATPPASPGPSAGSGPSYELSPSSASVSASVGSDDGGAEVTDAAAPPRAASDDDEWEPIRIPAAVAAEAAAAVAAASPASLASPPESPPIARTLSGARTIAPADGALLAERAAETLRRRHVGGGDDSPRMAG